MKNQEQTIDPAVSFPYRPILLLMLAVSALSLGGAGAALASAQSAPTVAAAD